MKTQLPSGANAELIQKPDTERGLLIIPDIMDLRPLFLDMAQDLSEKWNASIVTFQIFHRHPEATDLESHYSLAKELNDEEVLADVEAALSLLENPQQYGVIGFCMGGMYTLKSMASGLAQKGVGFYPQIKVPDTWKGPGQKEPLELLQNSNFAKDTMAVIGTIDDYTPPEDVDALRSLGAEIAQYEDCDHGFVHDPDRPAHKPQEAADAWSRAEKFLWG